MPRIVRRCSRFSPWPRQAPVRRRRLGPTSRSASSCPVRPAAGPIRDASFANKLGETLKWQMVVDNRPGAGGNLGLDIAAKAAPDGYTLVMGELSNLAINPYLYKKLPFDPAKDVAPVALVGTVPLVLVVSANSPFDSLTALVDAAKKSSSPSPRPATARWAIWSARCGSARWPPTCCTCPTRAPAR